MNGGTGYRLEKIALADLPKHQDLRKLNPFAKVPTLVHGKEVMTELAAIVLYLADIYHGTGIAPAPNTALRGQMYRYLFMAVNFEYAVFDKVRNVQVSEEMRVQNGYGDFDVMHRVLVERFGGRQYALGESYTLLDTYLTVTFMWALQMGALGNDDPLVIYAQQHMARPAIAKVMAQMGA